MVVVSEALEGWGGGEVGVGGYTYGAGDIKKLIYIFECTYIYEIIIWGGRGVSIGGR